MREFHQLDWDDVIVDDCRQVIRLAVREDLQRQQDWTTVSLVAPESRDRAYVVARQVGIVAGLPAAALVLDEMRASLQWSPHVSDGQRVLAGEQVATIEGSTRDLLTCERILLNMIGRLSGIATLTGQYVAAVGNYRAEIYDTRKTTPAWRRLEKYAVRCGGGHNHRTGLFDAILIKDNHLAAGRHAAAAGTVTYSVADAVRQAREFVQTNLPEAAEQMVVEIEVDTLEQLDTVLPARPDIVLLDNMSPDQLREAVALRDARDATIQLEASGGVNLETVSEIAATGVDRISVGALTHSARVLDFGLDWASD